MGTNRRYAHRIDELMDQRLLEVATRGANPQTLTASELELDKEPLTRPPKPRPIRAWVRFGEIPVLVNAEACSWTTYAVAIRFTIADAEHKIWVWSSAIREASPVERTPQH